MAGITRCFVLTKNPIRGPSEFSSKVFWHRVLSPYLKLHDVLSLVFHMDFQPHIHEFNMTYTETKCQILAKK